MHHEIDSYLEKAQEQIAGRLSGGGTHTPAMIELIKLVKDQQLRIEKLEAAILQK
jgi:hypothetical protein